MKVTAPGSLPLHLLAPPYLSSPTSAAFMKGWAAVTGALKRGREDLSHTRGQGLRQGGATPPPRSSGCTGAGGPRGAIPR